MHTNKKELSALEMLTARSHFLAVQGSGKKWVSKSLILQIKENDLGIIRTGYTVSKKVDKSAVKRNRIKRRLRAAAADGLTRHAKTGYDFVLVGRRETSTKDYKDIVSDLKWCLKKLDAVEKKD
ncbi:MAG: ribonuclease P protein component [Alphaproteobacteria bacterium]